MAKTKVIEKDHGLAKIVRTIKEIGDKELKAGVLESAGVNDEGVPYATIAAANEFGTKDGRIPARPFMGTTIEEELEEIVSLTKKYKIAVVTGKMSEEEVLKIIGNHIVTKARRKVMTLDKPPNAQSTIKAKGDNNPLVDELEMMTAISYEVE